MTRDLARLKDFSSRFVGSGHGWERAPVGGSQEVSGLASSINLMLDRLDEQHSTLLLKREKLSQLTEALRAADRRKDDFLAMRPPPARASPQMVLFERLQRRFMTA